MIPSVTSCLASSHAQVRTTASNTLDHLMDNVDKAEALHQLASVATHGNSRVKTAVLTKLASIVESHSYENPKYIHKHLVPMALAFLDERKGDVHRANQSLLRSIYNILGPNAFADPTNASRMSDSRRKKLLEALQSCDWN